jgi:hypothetical protein
MFRRLRWLLYCSGDVFWGMESGWGVSLNVVRPTPPVRPGKRGFSVFGCFRAIGTLIAVAFGPVAVAENAPAAATKRFEIPAGRADRALKLFSEQSGAEVAFAPKLVAEVKVNAIKGDYPLLEAAKLLLAGTSLVVTQEQRSGALLVNRASDPNASGAAQAAASDMARNSQKKDQDATKSRTHEKK